MVKQQSIEDVYSALFVDFDNIYMRLHEQDQNLARTDDRATLTQPGIIQTGVGMDADLKNRTYRIKSQVKVRYDTQKR